MAQSRVGAYRRSIVVVLVLSAILAGVGLQPAAADVSAAAGSAFGYHADNISLFGGAQSDTGPTPTVTLASNASNSPQEATAPSGSVVYGPATLFTSGPITVSTQGSLGPTGSVTSSSDIQNVETETSGGTGQGDEIFDADRVQSTATANEAGVSGSTTVTNGTVDTHSNSYNCTSLTTPCGGHTHPPDDPLTPLDESVGQVTVPTNPPVNHKIAGHVHLSDSSTDYYVIVFNEQIRNADGSITVNPVHEHFGAKLDPSGNIVSDPGSVLKGDLILGQSVSGVTVTATTRRAVADFDGDNDTDVSLFRPANGGWYVKDRPTTFFGLNGDNPVPADYDGVAGSELGVFRPTNGGWYRPGQPTVYFGRNGDVPVPADYDGNSKADIAVFRPSNGGWYIQGKPTTFHGVSGDIPVPADYDKDGDADIAVFRPSNGAWYIQGKPATFFGGSGDIPVPADYDKDGDADLAVFRPSNGAWYVQGLVTQFLGVKGDVPVAGDYNGDGTADRAVFRPSNGAWFIQGQTTVYFGRQGDIPLPLPYAVYRAFFVP